MSQTTLRADPASAALSTTPAVAPMLDGTTPCEECLGSGGWFRYEPALEPAPGLLYLSCVQCRGSGRNRLDVG